MPPTTTEALDMAQQLLRIRANERPRLETIRDYMDDDPDKRTLSGLPQGVPDEVRRLAKLARVNVLKYVVNSRVQNMFVDGFQTTDSSDNLESWDIWQRNGMDARQIGVHRAALAYGAAYVVVLPGDPVPVMRGASPLKLTVAYGDDDQWPAAALEEMRGGGWRLIDAESVYRLKYDSGQFAIETAEPHGMTLDGEPVCPVVRYRDTDDLDTPVRGIAEPFFALQDQINITTFGLHVAQHYGAFRQRYIIGWLADSEQEALKTGAARLMMFEDAPSDVNVGEFGQTDLRGYIESREASIRHLATVSQTPVHELMGEMINLSAEALEAARASHQAAVEENRIMCGESHEQSLNLAGESAGIVSDPSASVTWRDTRIRSLTEAAEGLGALVERLGVPPRSLWQRVPGVAQHELEQWRAMADQGDPFADLERLLDRQANVSNG